MGRRKGALRRKLNVRWLRWSASRALVSAAPALKRRINFYGEGVALEDAADALLWRDETVIDRPLRPEQAVFVETRCGPNDGPADPGYWRAPWRFVDEHFLVKDAWMLGHTGRLVDGAGRGVITGWGAPENWNRDRATWLGSAAPIDAVAVPVRSFKSYFHFFMDVAVPLTAYFESGRAPDRPHVLVVAPNERPFVTATLAALAARYGASIRNLPAGQKVRCAEAVSFRRQSPCSDWFPITPATAAALRAALIAHVRPETPEHLGPKLHLRRGREKLRNLENADALDALAEARGFRAFTPSSDNFAEQIIRAQAARAVLAVHGAALTNLIFAEPGARVVEIFSGDFCKSVYLALCQMLGHSHVGSVGGAGDYHQNFAADLEDVAAALDGEPAWGAAHAAPSP